MRLTLFRAEGRQSQHRRCAHRALCDPSDGAQGYDTPMLAGSLRPAVAALWLVALTNGPLFFLSRRVLASVAPGRILWCSRRSCSRPARLSRSSCSTSSASMAAASLPCPACRSGAAVGLGVWAAYKYLVESATRDHALAGDRLHRLALCCMGDRRPFGRTFRRRPRLGDPARIVGRPRSRRHGRMLHSTSMTTGAGVMTGRNSLAPICGLALFGGIAWWMRGTRRFGVLLVLASIAGLWGVGAAPLRSRP